MVNSAVETTETLLGSTFLLTQIGLDFHDIFGLSASDFLTFLGFYSKREVFYISYLTYSVGQCFRWTMQVVCVGIDVPLSSPSLVSERAVLSVAWVWLPVLQPYLTAIEILLIFLKEFVVHLLLVCAFISMRI